MSAPPPPPPTCLASAQPSPAQRVSRPERRRTPRRGRFAVASQPTRAPRAREPPLPPPLTPSVKGASQAPAELRRGGAAPLASAPRRRTEAWQKRTGHARARAQAHAQRRAPRPAEAAVVRAQSRRAPQLGPSPELRAAAPPARRDINNSWADTTRSSAGRQTATSRPARRASRRGATHLPAPLPRGARTPGALDCQALRGSARSARGGEESPRLSPPPTPPRACSRQGANSPPPRQKHPPHPLRQPRSGRLSPPLSSAPLHFDDSSPSGSGHAAAAARTPTRSPPRPAAGSQAGRGGPLEEELRAPSPQFGAPRQGSGCPSGSPESQSAARAGWGGEGRARRAFSGGRACPCPADTGLLSQTTRASTEALHGTLTPLHPERGVPRTRGWDRLRLCPCAERLPPPHSVRNSPKHWKGAGHGDRACATEQTPPPRSWCPGRGQPLLKSPARQATCPPSAPRQIAVLLGVRDQPRAPVQWGGGKGAAEQQPGACSTRSLVPLGRRRASPEVRLAGRTLRWASPRGLPPSPARRRYLCAGCSASSPWQSRGR